MWAIFRPTEFNPVEQVSCLDETVAVVRDIQYGGGRTGWLATNQISWAFTSPRSGAYEAGLGPEGPRDRRSSPA